MVIVNMHNVHDKPRTPTHSSGMKKPGAYTPGFLLLFFQLSERISVGVDIAIYGLSVPK